MKNIGCFLTFVLFSQIALAVTVQPFSLPQMNAEVPGTLYNSQEQKCKVFVVENYFLNCPYCNDNAPNVDALAEDFKDSELVDVLDVGIDKSDSQYAEWIRRHNPNHPVLKDSKKTLTNQLGTSGYPTTYVIDFEGKVVLKTSGVWSSSTKAKIRNKIKSLIRNNDCPVSGME